jgi:PAS domain S-box-containing protein
MVISPASVRRTSLSRYTVAVAAVALATLARLLLQPWITHDPDALYLGAVAVAAWYGGVGPGILAIGFSTVAQLVQIGPSMGAVALDPTVEGTGLAIWTAEGLLLCLILGALVRSQARADGLLGEVRRVNSELLEKQHELADARNSLEQTVGERTEALRAANVSLVQEVSDRVSAQVALRDIADAHHLLFAASPLPMWVIDAETHRFVEANAAAEAHYGYSVEEFRARTLFDVRREEDADVLRESLQASETTFEGVAEHRTKAGKLIQVDVRARRLVFAGRASWLAVIHDVTERVAIEERLRQSQKMDAIGRLAGGVAHDFNNLLSVILSYASLLMDDLREDDPIRADLAEIHTAGRRAGELTRQLLAFSRQQVLAPKIVDLGQLVGGMESMLGRILGEDVELRSSLSALPARVKVDPGQIEQVIMNLAVNARDAMPDGGQLRIATGVVQLAEGNPHGLPHGSYGCLRVADTGTGMDIVTQARVFEPFFTTKSVGKGTGLGLATVFGIVRQSGGAIEVLSEVGKGTEFRVFLPLFRGEVTARFDSPRRIPLARNRETVLLVEDETSVRDVARDILLKLGYQVREAAGASEAMRIAEQSGPIDLLLTDVVMPGMNGPTLARNLLVARPDMKVVCMSGYAGEALADRRLVEGTMGFVQKPFTPSALARKLNSTLRGQPETDRPAAMDRAEPSPVLR